MRFPAFDMPLWVIALAALTVLQPQASEPPAEPAPAAAEAPGIGHDAIPRPFSAHYVAEWKNISVGTSDLQLQIDKQAGRYHYTWTTSARGIFRLVYSSDLIQQSWLRVIDDQVRPEKYRAEEGSSSVSFDFDWDSGHARGSTEGKPLDLALPPGTQDLLSIQIAVMLDLKNGNLPPTFHIIDKDRVKEFSYRREGETDLETALGTLHTVIVASRQTGSNRILRMWFAPELGFVPIQAERTRENKLEFAIRIRSLKR
ncbi:MAG TPA: DUF3108 domain-containing protein [Steroidobacteraceae bacterium]|nr:DUF3108 domain-containing protein [Steroidobacteraceae bacterium]